MWLCCTDSAEDDFLSLVWLHKLIRDKILNPPCPTEPEQQLSPEIWSQISGGPRAQESFTARHHRKRTCCCRLRQTVAATNHMHSMQRTSNERPLRKQRGGMSEWVCERQQEKEVKRPAGWVLKACGRQQLGFSGRSLCLGLRSGSEHLQQRTSTAVSGCVYPGRASRHLAEITLALASIKAL